VANASAMTIICVALIAVYLDMRSFLIGEIEYQRSEQKVWQAAVSAQHNTIHARLQSLCDKVDNLRRDHPK
jgi:hypothetical protein